MMHFKGPMGREYGQSVCFDEAHVPVVDVDEKGLYRNLKVAFYAGNF